MKTIGVNPRTQLHSVDSVELVAQRLSEELSLKLDDLEFLPVCKYLPLTANS